VTTTCWTRFLLLVLGIVFVFAAQDGVFAQKPAAPAKESSAEAILLYRGAVPLQNKGNYDLAVEEWEKFLTQFPNDPLAVRARYYAGVCYLQLQQYDKAAAAFEKVRTDEPAFDQLEALSFNLGMTYLNAAKKQEAGEKQKAEFEKAATTFGDVVKKYPTGSKIADALYNQADSLYLAKNKEAAIPLWRQLVDKYTDSALRADALYNIGVTQQELNKPADAGKTYDEFLKSFAKDTHAAEVTLRKGMTLYDQKQYAEAEKRFAAAAAIKDFSQADYALLRQGDTLLALDKPADAAGVYVKLWKTYPKSDYAGDAVLQAGKSYSISGNQDEAKKLLVPLTSIEDARGAEAAHWLARAYLKQNQPSEAVKIADEFIKVVKDANRKSELELDRAEALYAMADKKADALAAFAKLAADAPKSDQAPVARYMAGQTALELGQYAEATKWADQFLAEHKQHDLTPYVLFVSAEASLLGDDAAKAATVFDRLLKDYPQHGEVNTWKLRRGWSYLRQKQYKEAADYFTTLVKDLKKPEQLAEANYLLGNSYLEQQQYAPAIKAYDVSLVAQAKSRVGEEVLLNLARAQRGNNDLNGAKASLNRLLKDFPQTAQADRVHFRLGELQHAASEFKAAATEFQWVVDNMPKSVLFADSLFGLAAAQAAQGDHAAAAKLYGQLIDKHSGEKSLVPRAKFGRAVAGVQQGDYKNAIADLRDFLKSADKGSQTSEARYLLGYALAAEKNYEEAITTLLALLKDDPQYAQADKVLYELAWAQQSADKKDAARDTFTKLAKDFPKSQHAAESWINVGDYAYQEKKDYAAAADAYDKSLAAGATDSLGESALHMLGWSLFNQNDFANAGKRFNEQVTKYPQGKKLADGTFMAGESLFKQNQYETALPQLEQASALELSSPLYKELALVHAAQSASQLKKWDLTLKLAERFAKAFPASVYAAEALYEQGWAQQNLKKNDAALKLYEQAVLAATKSSKAELAARAKFMAGEILFELGQHKEAIKQFYQVAYGSDPKTFAGWQANSLYEAARCFEVLKNVDQAKKLYNELVGTYPESDKVKLAQERLSALK
jgi:TolA-binding protein